MKTSLDTKNNSVTFPVSTKIYPKEVVYKACYVFIDRMYILLDMPVKKDVISVTLKGKTTLTRKGIEKLEGEFMNELLNSLVRENVSKRNRKVLEQIVGGALGAALGVRGMEGNDRIGDVRNETGDRDDDAEAKEIEAAVEALKRELAEIETGEDYENDALGIRTIVSDMSVRESVGGRESRDSRDEDGEIEAAVEALKRELAEIEAVEAVAVSKPEKKSAKKTAKKTVKKVAAKKPVTGKSTNKKNGHGKGNKR